jgi:dienelactone hydrolase
MTEQAVTFGPDQMLLGVFTPASSPARTAIIMINAGIIHRVGPHRISVKLARALAQAGVAALRFDLSGRGDSPTASSTAGYDEQAVRDVRAAMDFLEREHGIRQFLLFGICSGAVCSFRTAKADPRVLGMFMVDGYWYRTKWSKLARLWLRLRKLPLPAIFASLLRRLKPKPAEEAVEQGGIFAVTEDNNPPRRQFADDLNAMTARGVRPYFLFTNSVTEQVSYASQLAQAFAGEPFVPRMQGTLDLSIDHTMTGQAAQRRTVELVRDWAVAAARPSAG